MCLVKFALRPNGNVTTLLRHVGGHFTSLRIWAKLITTGLRGLRGCCRSFISRVAQLVEQAAVNRLVAGSSPAAGALKIPIEIIQTWGPTEWSVN